MKDLQSESYCIQNDRFDYHKDKNAFFQAIEKGAKHFVVFSLNRHISENNMLANANAAIEMSIAFLKTTSLA